jgi:diguanylate cyclase (GGDEF)-like protein/PAS domain S-box-containing protein
MTQDDSELHSADRVPSQDEIAAQAAMYRLMVESAIDLIIRYDAAGLRTYVSPSCREMLGYEPREMLGRHLSDFFHPDDFAQTLETLNQVGPAMPTLDLSFRVIRRDGGVIWIEGRYRYLPTDGSLLAILRDITRRKHTEAQLAATNAKLGTANRLLLTLAQQDGLTGLANRHRFDELMQQEFRRARRQEQPLSLLMVDADRLRAYNGRYGHLAGDECLRQIGRAIESVLWRPGDHAARYGGEEFVVLLPACDIDGAERVAERIRRQVEALHDRSDSPTAAPVSVSIGLAGVRDARSTTPTELIRAADMAMYDAKHNGRNQVRRRAVHAEASMNPISVT